MVNTAVNEEEKRIQDKESKEESILAMLGIIGTILNLIVIIFVYIYTTLWHSRHKQFLSSEISELWLTERFQDG